MIVLSPMLAMFEPALYWIDEALKGEAASRRAGKGATPAASTPPTPLPVEKPANDRHDNSAVTQPAPRVRRAGKTTVVLATATAVAGGVAATKAEAARPAPIVREAAPAAAKVQRPQTADERAKAEAYAVALLDAGWKVGRALERETGLHRDTLARIDARRLKA